LHFIRSVCGGKVGDKCIVEGTTPTDPYLLSSYLFPFLVGATPEDTDHKPLRLYYQQNDGYFYNYLLSNVWMGGSRLTVGHVRKELPAFDVHWSSNAATAPIFPLLDPEFLYIADSSHAASHPGIIAAGETLSGQGAPNVGTWNSQIPGCTNQKSLFDNLSEAERAMYRVDSTVTPVFGDPSEACGLTSAASRFLAMALKDQMYVYSLNQGAVDYLAGIRADHKAIVIGRLFEKAIPQIAGKYNTAASFRQLTRGQVH
jgi:hypothetical protein